MKKSKWIAVCLAMVMLLVVLCGCSSKNAMIGTWIQRESLLGIAMDTTYTFEKDGTGIIGTSIGANIIMTYTVEGDQLTIVYNLLGVENRTAYTFEIKNDTLTMVSGEETLHLSRVKD